MRRARRRGSQRQVSRANKPISRHRGEIIILFRLEEARAACRPRRQYADNFPAHKVLTGARLFHLLADSHFVPGSNQACDIIFRCVIRHPAHGNGIAFFFVARGECDLQNARSHHRVLEKEFVEIPQTEQQQGSRMLLLERVVLPHQWSCRFGHESRLCSRRAQQGRAGKRLSG